MIHNLLQKSWARRIAPRRLHRIPKLMLFIYQPAESASGVVYSPKCWEAKFNVCHLVIDLERLVRRATQNESWQCKCWRTLPRIRPCISRSVVQERTPPSAMPSMPDLCKVEMWVQILPLRFEWLPCCWLFILSPFQVVVKLKLVCFVFQPWKPDSFVQT